ncbi:MAG: SurA N-terminal domain-containing protein [Burkholderiaceae bacterium]
MFDVIRNNQRVLMFVLVLLIFPAFAFFGISGYDRFFVGDNAVAVVEDSPITVQEFNEVRRAQIENFRRILGDRFDPAMFDTARAREELLDGLIDQRVLALHANESQIAVPDEALRAEIQRVPQFQNESGAFDPERYRSLLAAQGQNELAFESRLRVDLALQMIPRVIAESAFVPSKVADRLAAEQLEKRRFRTMNLDPADFIEKVSVDDAAARKYYEENKERFRSAEAVKAEYLILSQAALAKTVEVSDAEIKEYYENNRARYVQEAQRKARHILVTVAEGASEAEVDAARKKIEAIRARLAAGEAFEEVAKTESQDPGSAANGGDLGWFDRQTMVKPFADAAFDLPVGKLSEPVRSEFGFHLIEVTDSRAEQQRPLAEVRDEVVSAIRTQKARQRFLDLAETFTNTVYEQPDSLAAAADKAGLQVQTVERLERSGGNASGDAAVLSNARLLRALFDPRAIKDRTNIEAIDLGDNTLVSARVLDHMPSVVRPFEQVEAEASAAVRASEAARLARDAGASALASIKAGKLPEDHTFGEAQTRTRENSGLPPDVARQVFAAPAEGLPTWIGQGLGERGYLIVELQAVEPASADAVADAAKQVASQQAGLTGGAVSEAYLDSVAAGMRIERHLERVAPADARN